MFIAEIGINHDGDLLKAIELILMAKECGADVVKFQKRNPDVCVPEPQKNQQRVFHSQNMRYIDYKHLLEFGEEEYDIINNYCKNIDMKWTASVWDVDSVKFMERYKDEIPFIKIPSACITDTELIDAVNKLGVPVIMSNGMSTQEEVDEAISKIDNLYAILHCNSSYPSNGEELDLNVIPAYKERYPNLKVGFSSHCESMMPVVIAYALGAEIIECHITHDKQAEGTDHKFSLDKHELRVYVSAFEKVDKMRGNSYLTCYESEKKVQSKLRRTLGGNENGRLQTNKGSNRAKRLLQHNRMA